MSVRARYLAVIISLITMVVAALAYLQCARLMSEHLAAKVAAENMIATNALALAQRAVNDRPQMSAHEAIKDDTQVRAWLDAVGENQHFSYLGILAADNTVLVAHYPLHFRANSSVLPFATLDRKSWVRQWLRITARHLPL